MGQKGNITRISSNTVPLCMMPDGRLVCYQTGDIIVYEHDVELQRFPLFRNIKERLFSQYKPASRFFRLGLRTAIALNNKRVIISIGDKLYELSLNSGSLSEGWRCGKGIRPLILTDVEGINCFDKGIYFGEYYKNDALEPVHIYHRTGIDQWFVVYTFPQGTIKHIHNLVADPYRQCVWIMTGDFGEAAALWKASDNFKKVELVAGGVQRWRGCVGFAVPEGLIYATDTPFSENHIYLLRDNGAVETLSDISGSCIYGCQWKDKFVFSTVVEPDGRNETLLRLLFGWKRGAGINDNYARIYSGDLNNGFTEIYKENKDLWPFIFQFGAFRFPAGNNNTDMLYFQPVATNRNDLRLLAIKK